MQFHSRLGQILLLLWALAPLAALSQEGDDQPPALAASALTAGYAAIEAGDLDLAEKTFTALLALDEDLAPAWLGLGLVREAQGNLVEALRLSRQSCRLAPNAAGSQLKVAELLARLDRIEPSLEAFARVRDLDPKILESYLVPAILLRGLSREEEAVALLQQGAVALPESPEIPEQTGLILLAIDQPAKALEIARSALSRHPDRGGLHLVEGLALARDPERYDQAIEQLERALELGAPQEGRIRLELVSMLTDLGREDESLIHLKAAAELLPDTPEVQYRLGTALRASGDLAGAREALTRFQQLSRDHDAKENLEREIGIALNEAQALAQSNQLAEALVKVDSLLEEHPEAPRALALKAKILFSLGKREDALFRIRQARDLDADAVEYHFLEGVFALTLQRYGEAQAALLQALALQPDLGEAYAYLGEIAADRGDPSSAAAAFERALELGADGPRVRAGYAAVLRLLGRTTDADAQMDALNPQGEP